MKAKDKFYGIFYLLFLVDRNLSLYGTFSELFHIPNNSANVSNSLTLKKSFKLEKTLEM